MALLSRVLNHHSDKPERRERSYSIRNSSSNNSSSSNLTPTRSGPAAISHGSPPTAAFSISIALESPPIVLYGQPSESTGSIVSGLLKLEIRPPFISKSSLSKNDSLASSTEDSLNSEIELESVTLSLVQTMRYTKPFIIPSSSVSNCKDCVLQTTTLARWDVLTSTASFAVGSHAYPFSHLLPGSLPASSKLGSINSQTYIKYDLIAVAKKVNSLTETTIKLPINISRSILRGPDRNSLRVFPPTEVTASAVLPNVIYPKSTFPVELKLDNIVSNSGDRRWRMRKLGWKIEETIKVRASTCKKHSPKLKSLEGSQKKVALNKDTTTTASKPSLHHSTIQTNMTLMHNPRSHSRVPHTEQSGGNQDEIVENDPNNDLEETIRSGPTHAQESFIQDFIRPATIDNNNNIEPTSSTSSNSNSNNITPEPTRHTEAEEHLYLEETRAVAHGEIKSGWKSDFSGRGKIELVADISANNCSTGLNKYITKINSEEPKPDDLQTGLRNGANVSCDIDDPTLGIFVNHTLIVEVVVAEEVVHNVRPKRSDSILGLSPIPSNVSTHVTPPRSNASQRASTPQAEPVAHSSSTSTTATTHSASSAQMGVPTGAARVLRMQFKLCVTERSGLGIAWDDEVPPTYEDVRTLSPPNYSESPRIGTPSSTPLTGRETPNVLYGIGDTPVIGSFAANRDQENILSIDGLVDLDERIQEFTL